MKYKRTTIIMVSHAAFKLLMFPKSSDSNLGLRHAFKLLQLSFYLQGKSTKYKMYFRHKQKQLSGDHHLEFEENRRIFSPRKRPAKTKKFNLPMI